MVEAVRVWVLALVIEPLALRIIVPVALEMLLLPMARFVLVPVVERLKVIPAAAERLAMEVTAVLSLRNTLPAEEVAVGVASPLSRIGVPLAPIPDGPVSVMVEPVSVLAAASVIEPVATRVTVPLEVALTFPAMVMLRLDPLMRRSKVLPEPVVESLRLTEVVSWR